MQLIFNCGFRRIQHLPSLIDKIAPSFLNPLIREIYNLFTNWVFCPLLIYSFQRFSAPVFIIESEKRHSIPIKFGVLFIFDFEMFYLCLYPYTVLRLFFNPFYLIFITPLYLNTVLMRFWRVLSGHLPKNSYKFLFSSSFADIWFFIPSTYIQFSGVFSGYF